MKPATCAIHSGFDGDPSSGATAVPVHQTAAYAFGSAKELADIFAGRAPGHVYTRISNPTNLALERRLSELEGGVGCIVTASGMAAISAAAMGLLKAGDEVLTTRGIFGGTLSFFQNVLGRFGVTTALVDAGDTAAFESALTDATRLIFLETITNPTMDVPDLTGISAIAQARRIPLLVDATATTPALAQMKEFGADLVVHSTTKFINGHGTAIGGALIDTGRYDWANGLFDDLHVLGRRAGAQAFLAYLRTLIHRDLGGCAAPQNSFLMLQGLETLHARMPIHCANASRLAAFLTARSAVAGVNYPGLPDSPYHSLVVKQFGGQGGAILTFDLGTRERSFSCLDRFRLAKRMTNLGDAKTLVLHPASTIFAEYDAETRSALGVGDGIVRVSVGIEDYEDIEEDFTQALAGA